MKSKFLFFSALICIGIGALGFYYHKALWAFVIWFSKTLFTPEGVDIISKKEQLDKSLIQEIKTKMLADSLLKKHVSNLKDL